MVLQAVDGMFLGMLALIFLGMWLLMIRPANRRMREQLEAQRALGEGDRVVLTSGIFATIRHAGEKQVVVEIAPDVLVTVLRQAIVRAAAPDEEEFEFTDEIDPAPVAPVGDVVEAGYDHSAETATIPPESIVPENKDN